MVNKSPIVWLVGNQGMLGRQLHRQIERMHIPCLGSDREVDIRDLTALKTFSAGHNFSWIVNCAAYTAVDAAENDRQAAFALNALGPENLAHIAHEKNCPLLHISTDYVFNGQSDQLYDENSQPDPQSVYGLSKLAGEQAIAATHNDHLILRISWLYGIYGKNFVETMIRLFKEKGQVRVVNDQIGAPTYAAALADNIGQLVKNNPPARGLFHYADQGEISWYEFACAIAEEALVNDLITTSPIITPIPSSEFPTPAKRPANSCFCKTRAIRELGLFSHPWRENLSHYFEERRNLHAQV